MALTDKKCIPCQGGIPPLKPAEIKPLLSQLKNNWQVIANKKIRSQFKFKDFNSAIEFINKVARIAEKQGHHPNIHLTNWNQVQLDLYTHKIGGLHLNDFILAAKIEKVQSSKP